MRIIYVNGPRPFGDHTDTIKLNGWAVANAPRPLPGEITWTGEFRHGIHYAAGPIGEFGSAWTELDGWPVQTITNLEITERLRQHCLEHGASFSEVVECWGSVKEAALAGGWPWYEGGEQEL